MRIVISSEIGFAENIRCTPEQALILAIISRAACDYLGLIEVKSDNMKRERKVYQRSAAKFLFHGEAARLLDIAGYEGQILMHTLLKRIRECQLARIKST